MTDTIDEAVGASTVPDLIEARNGLILVAKNVRKPFGGLMAVKDMSLEKAAKASFVAAIISLWGRACRTSFLKGSTSISTWHLFYLDKQKAQWQVIF